MKGPRPGAEGESWVPAALKESPWEIFAVQIPAQLPYGSGT